MVEWFHRKLRKNLSKSANEVSLNSHLFNQKNKKITLSKIQSLFYTKPKAGKDTTEVLQGFQNTLQLQMGRANKKGAYNLLQRADFGDLANNPLFSSIFQQVKILLLEE